MNYEQILEHANQLERRHVEALPTIRSAAALLTELAKVLDKPITERLSLGEDTQDYPHQFQHSDWDCAFSPTHYCMYTYHCGEDCIFCGQPEERK